MESVCFPWSTGCVVNWDAVGAVGEWAGALFTAAAVSVALLLARRDHGVRERDADRRARLAAARVKHPLAVAATWARVGCYLSAGASREEIAARRIALHNVVEGVDVGPLQLTKDAFVDLPGTLGADIQSVVNEVMAERATLLRIMSDEEVSQAELYASCQKIDSLLEPVLAKISAVA